MESMLDFFVSPAFAQAAEPQGGGMQMIIMMVVLFAIFYFLIIRPQNKKQKEHREMVSALSTGDEIVTAGGVLGKVTAVNEQFLDLEIADNVTIKVQRHTVSAVLPKGSLKNA
jgi:preprotein translocase subunit YajC